MNRGVCQPQLKCRQPLFRLLFLDSNDQHRDIAQLPESLLTSSLRCIKGSSSLRSLMSANLPLCRLRRSLLISRQYRRSLLSGSLAESSSGAPESGRPILKMLWPMANGQRNPECDSQATPAQDQPCSHHPSDSDSVRDGARSCREENHSIRLVGRAELAPPLALRIVTGLQALLT